MSILEHEKPLAVEVLGRQPATHWRPPAGQRRSWLAAALVMALLIATSLGGWLYLDHRQTDRERAQVALAAAWVDAYNAHDAPTLWSLTRWGWTWESVGGQSGRDGPYAGTTLLHKLLSDWTADELAGENGDEHRRIDPLAAPVVLGDKQVAVPARNHGHPGTLLFDLMDGAAGPKIAQAIWLSAR